MPTVRARAGLAGLIVLGIGLRVLSSVAVWPVGLALWDSGVYAESAARSPLSDIHAPAG